jgi:hypothetical protein
LNRRATLAFGEWIGYILAKSRSAA